MTNQNLSLSVPSKWKEHFLIKRIDEKDIEISLEERDAILRALNQGTRFIQIRKFILMVNSIKSIDPLYEPDNIPPRPKEEYQMGFDEKRQVGIQELVNKEEIEEWESLFGDKILKTI